MSSVAAHPFPEIVAPRLCAPHITAISSAGKDKSELRVEQFIKHLNTYCDRLEYMRNMFRAGKAKQIVLEAMISMHRPLSYWQKPQGQVGSSG